MRICFLTHNIFTLGGVQRVVTVLANELSKYHNVDIICIEKGVIEDREIYNLNPHINIIRGEEFYKKNIINKLVSRFGIYLNNKTGIFNKKKFNFISKEIYFPKQSRKKMVNFFNNQKYDVVIGVEGIYSLLLAMISNQINTKTIGWQHNSYDAYFNIESKYCWNMNELFKEEIPKLNNYVVLTEHDKKMFKEMMELETIVIHNPRSFESIEKSSLSNKQFLAAGRLEYQKGFDLLIESFNIFAKLEENWNLVIVGDGNEKDNINSLILKYKLEDRVMIKSFTDNIKEYFLDSSALLLSSRWEGMPMIVLEAFEMGVPIIGYNISAVTELLNNREEGLIVNKFDTNKFSDAMIEFTKNDMMRKVMSQNCIIKSNQFSIEYICSKWNQIIK